MGRERERAVSWGGEDTPPMVLFHWDRSRCIRGGIQDVCPNKFCSAEVTAHTLLTSPRPSPDDLALSSLPP